MTTPTDDGAREPRSKVERVIDRYGLDGLGDELAALWTGEAGERRSLRDLEDLVNRRVLAAAMREAGVDPLPGEVDSLYGVLDGTEGSEGTRVEVTARLERQGVPVERVRRDFVSHQSIHTYLTDDRGVAYEPGTVDDAERRRQGCETVASLRNRTEAVTRGTIETLRNADALGVDGFEVLVDVRVTCDECGRAHDAVDLLERGGCPCRTD